MKLLSSIIKGGRIRNQTSIDLSERFNISNLEYYTTLPNEDEMKDEMKDAEVERQTDSTDLEAEAILDEARQRAEEILRNALDEAEAIKKAAEAEKLNLLQEVVKKQETLLEQAKKESKQIYDEACYEKQQIIKGIEEELADTLKSLLQYLVGEEVYNNKKWLLGIVRRMLSNDGLKTDIKILVSPHLYSKLTDEDREKLTSTRDHVTLHASEAISDTACRVESTEGAIEYDVQSGLDQVISDIKILQNLKQANV